MQFVQALDALESDTLFSDLMGKTVVETHLTLKRDEIDRYMAQVPDPSTREITQWEHDEYIADF